MARYRIDAYTHEDVPEPMVRRGHPVQTWHADTVTEVACLLHNCTRTIAGIRRLDIWIDESDDRAALPNFDPLPPRPIQVAAGATTVIHICPACRATRTSLTDICPNCGTPACLNT